MSELQLGLLGVGVLVVLGIFGYNKWQERHSRRDAETRFKSDHDDVLLDATKVARPPAAKSATNPPEERHRVEPRLGATAPGTALGPTAAAPIDDVPPMPVQARLSTATLEATSLTGEPKPHPVLDERIDLIAFLSLETPAPGFELKSTLAANLPQDSLRPILADGYDHVRAGFDRIADRQVYESVRIGLQLANRKGAAKSVDLETFHQVTVKIAETLGAQITWPEEENPLTRAAALDGFCAEVDIQLGLNLIASDAAFAGTKVRALSEANGLQLEADGRFRRYADSGEVLYSMSDLENRPFAAADMKHMTARGLTLTLDVPTSPPELRAFDLLSQAAKHFSNGLGVPVMDDTRRPLSDAQIVQIRDQLEPIRALMEKNGIPAGGALAKRLFS